MFTGIKGQEITVYEGGSDYEGSCNGCTSYIGSSSYASLYGQVSHRVWVIKVRNASIRFCDECKKELLKQLKSY